MRHVGSGDHYSPRPSDVQHLSIVGEPRHAYPARKLLGLGCGIGDTDQFHVRMPQRTIDVRLADCSGADDTYGHLAHELISNGFARRASTDITGEVPSTRQARVRGNRRSRTWNVPIATAYLERRDRNRGMGHHLIGPARHITQESVQESVE